MSDVVDGASARQVMRPEDTADATAARDGTQTKSGIAERTFDLVIASLLLLLLSPLMIVIAIMIRLTSAGPALFRQERIGWRGSAFVMFKFRTMFRDNDDSEHRAFVSSMLNGEVAGAEGGVYKLTRDPRVTGVGRVLRKTSLDELPQLFNVLRGTMSLVGPRPALPWEVELFDPRYRARFDVRPGITGLWQVSGRNTLTMPQALELDVAYVRRRTLGLDTVILLKTIPAVIAARGVG
jgi:lipopolysaccharide/colanic/teichoic acid biosynthesis glycosyltransferase